MAMDGNELENKQSKDKVQRLALLNMGVKIDPVEIYPSFYQNDCAYPNPYLIMYDSKSDVMLRNLFSFRLTVSKLRDALSFETARRVFKLLPKEKRKTLAKSQPIHPFSPSDENIVINESCEENQKNKTLQENVIEDAIEKPETKSFDEDSMIFQARMKEIYNIFICSQGSKFLFFSNTEFGNDKSLLETWAILCKQNYAYSRYLKTDTLTIHNVKYEKMFELASFESLANLIVPTIEQRWEKIKSDSLPNENPSPPTSPDPNADIYQKIIFISNMLTLISNYFPPKKFKNAKPNRQAISDNLEELGNCFLEILNKPSVNIRSFGSRVLTYYGKHLEYLGDGKPGEKHEDIMSEQLYKIALYFGCIFPASPTRTSLSQIL